MRHCICWLTVCAVKGMDGVHGGGEDALTAWGEVSSGIVGFCGAFNLFCFVFCVLCSVFSSRGPIVGMAALFCAFWLYCLHAVM